MEVIYIFEIPWYLEDNRFKPGTVADIGNSFRLKLRKVKDKDEYRLFFQIRTLKENGVEDGLKREIKIATFKKCPSLYEAQMKSSKWMEKWLGDILEYISTE